MDSEKNTGREKVTTGHEVLTSSAGRNRVHLCLIVTVVFGFIQSCGVSAAAPAPQICLLQVMIQDEQTDEAATPETRGGKCVGIAPGST